jgi:hypothetical protein
MATENFKRYRGRIYTVSVYEEAGNWVALIRIGEREGDEELTADVQVHDRGHATRAEAMEGGEQRARAIIDELSGGGSIAGNQ